LKAGLASSHRIVEFGCGLGYVNRRAHRWALEAGFDIVHCDAYHPHYLTGEHKGF
jgi:cyclopropane fatty-acyl-phospholipid synthase-like methyltransferase